VHVLYLTEERITFSEPLVRGGAIHVRNVVGGLRERGRDVTLIDWSDDSDPDSGGSPGHRSVSGHPIVEGALRTLAEALDVGRADDPPVDVVVSKTRKVYLPGLAAARLLGVPHVVHVGSTIGDRTGLADRVGQRSFETRLRAPHDAYFVVCEYIARQLRDRGVSGAIYDVRNAVDAGRFAPETARDAGSSGDDDRAELRRRFNGIDGPVVGYVGGLHRYKGLFELATAIERCERDVTAVIAGDGPARERLEIALGDSAVFLGAVPYEAVPAVYHGSDIVALPSHTEGLPRVILEAYAAETPVVATSVGGVPEVVEDGETGLLCPPRAPDRLADAIDALAGDPDERARMGRRGREVVESDYSWADLYERYERGLNLIVGKEDG
jgi:glycosyltransferase involved in cell wall biosynthesis